MTRFHALWLGYDRMPHEAALAAAMRAETDALIGRVLFELKAPWQDLFRSGETFLGDTMARHYGDVPPPGSSQPRWTPYGTAARRGLLSHGSFLSVGGKFGDTSPTVRGKMIRERLFCQDIPDPEPALLEQFKVDTDNPPATGTSPCKWDRYAAQRALSPVCNGCHELTDLVGFGLENYDAQGRYRTVDRDRESGRALANCTIRGEGELAGVGKFAGPAGLGRLMADAPGLVNRCVVTQLYRFTFARHELDRFDDPFLADLVSWAGQGAFRFDELIANLVATDAFLHRRAN